MKVLHVVRGLANSSGTTHIVVPLSEEQARQGCDVSVYYVEKGAGSSVLHGCNKVAGIAALRLARISFHAVTALDAGHALSLDFPSWNSLPSASLHGPSPQVRTKPRSRG